MWYVPFSSILEKDPLVSSFFVSFMSHDREIATMCALTMAWIDYYRVLAHETHSIISHEIYCTRTSSIVHLAFANDKSSVCSPTQHDIITHLCLLTSCVSAWRVKSNYLIMKLIISKKILYLYEEWETFSLPVTFSLKFMFCVRHMRWIRGESNNCVEEFFIMLHTHTLLCYLH